MGLKSLNQNYTKLLKAFDEVGVKLNESQKESLDTFMIDLEKKECKYDKKKHAARLDRILQKWQDILSIVQEEIPKPLDIEEILKLTGMEELLSEQDDRELFIVFQATKDIRDKYVLSRLLWDLGLIEEIFFNNQNN